MSQLIRKTPSQPTPPIPTNPPATGSRQYGLFVPKTSGTVTMVDMYHEDTITDWGVLKANAQMLTHKCWGENGPDSKFSSRWPEFKARGFKRGAYDYYTRTDGASQAGYFLDAIDKAGGLDPEDDFLANDYEPKNNLSIDSKYISSWGDRIRKDTKRKPTIYSYRSGIEFLSVAWGSEAALAKDFYIWVAYPHHKQYPLAAVVQFSLDGSSTFPGMQGNEVDVNVIMANSISEVKF